MGVNESEGQIVRLRVAFFKEGRFPTARRPGRIALDPSGFGKYPAPCANCSQAVENRLSLVCPPFSFTPPIRDPERLPSPPRSACRSQRGQPLEQPSRCNFRLSFLSFRSRFFDSDGCSFPPRLPSVSRRLADLALARGEYGGLGRDFRRTLEQRDRVRTPVVFLTYRSRPLPPNSV